VAALLLTGYLFPNITTSSMLGPQPLCHAGCSHWRSRRICRCNPTLQFNVHLQWH